MAFPQDTFESALAQQKEGGISINAIIDFVDKLKKRKAVAEKAKLELAESEIEARKAGFSILDEGGQLTDAPRRLSPEEVLGDLQQTAESAGLDLTEFEAAIPGGTATFERPEASAAAETLKAIEVIMRGGVAPADAAPVAPGAAPGVAVPPTAAAPGIRPSKIAAKLPGGITATFDVPPTAEAITEARRQEALDIQSKEEAKQEVEALTAGAATTVTSAESAIKAIDELIELERANPGVIKFGLAPATPPFGGKATQRADKLLKVLRLEITTARGGKQLTKTEIEFINKVFPSLFARDDINIGGLIDMREALVNVRTRILGEARVKHEAEGVDERQALVDRLVAKFGGGGG